MALEGKLDHVYGYSLILTNLDVSTPAKLVEAEHWYRHRTDIEALDKDADTWAPPHTGPDATRTDQHPGPRHPHPPGPTLRPAV